MTSLMHSTTFYLFFYFCLRWVFVAACGLSLVAASGADSQVAVCRLLTAVASPVEEHGFQGLGASGAAISELSSCGSWAPQAQ